MADLTQEQWTDKMNSIPEAIILDVRTDAEVAEGYIRGARQMDISDPPGFMSTMDELDPDATYLIYCRSGSRSGQACALFKSRGFKEVYNLIGGILEWRGELVNP